MHPVILGSLAFLALGAQAQTTTPPNGISAFYDIFDHVGCDITSIGKMMVETDNVGKCQNFLGPAISIKLTEVAEGCTLTAYPGDDCVGAPYQVNNSGVCENYTKIMKSGIITC